MIEIGELPCLLRISVHYLTLQCLLRADWSDSTHRWRITCRATWSSDYAAREKHYHGDKGIEVLSPEGIYCYNLIHQAQIGVFWEQLKPEHCFIHW